MSLSQSAVPTVDDAVAPIVKPKRRSRAATATTTDPDTAPPPRKPRRKTQPVALAESSPLPITEQVACQVPEPADVRSVAIPEWDSDLVNPELGRMVRAGRYARLPAFGPQAILGLRLPSRPAAEPDPYCALVLEMPAGELELSDGVRLLMALTGIAVGQSAVALPQSQWLHAAALGRLGATPLRDASAISRGCLNHAEAVHALRLTLRSASHSFSIDARASLACWRDLLARGNWEHVRAIGLQADLPMSMPVRIGSHVLPAELLAGIACGDILLPETCWFDCSGQGRMQSAGWHMGVAWAAPGGLIINHLEVSMDADSGVSPADEADAFVIVAQTPSAAALSVQSLPVQLHFDMGHLNTTLGQLQTLAAGIVVPIEGGSPAAIAITAAGRRLGQGELVEVNGKLGIRIVHWEV